MNTLFSTHYQYGELYIYEIYEFYDIPILFTCQNKLGHKFLVMLIDNTQSLEQWLLIEISDERLNQLKNGRSTLRETFLNAELGNGQIININSFNDLLIEADNVNQILCSSLSEDYLPTELYQFKPIESTEYITVQNNLVIDASQKQREALYFRLIGPAIGMGEMAFSKLSKFLDLMQGTFDTIAQSLETSSLATISAGGRIPNSISSRVKLNFAGTYAGSFGIKVIGDNDSGLFKETSLLNKTFEKFKEIVSVERIDQIDTVVSGLKHRPVKKMADFFQFLAASDLGVDMGYVFPNDEIQRVEFTKDISKIIASSLSDLPDNNQNLIELKGILRAIDLDKKIFTLIDESDQKVYHGKIKNDIMEYDAVKSATVNKKYQAQILENIDEIEGEPVKISYILNDISYETI